jgi:hypothetical protein
MFEDPSCQCEVVASCATQSERIPAVLDVGSIVAYKRELPVRVDVIAHARCLAFHDKYSDLEPFRMTTSAVEWPAPRNGERIVADGQAWPNGPNMLVEQKLVSLPIMASATEGSSQAKKAVLLPIKHRPASRAIGVAQKFHQF